MSFLADRAFQDRFVSALNAHPGFNQQAQWFDGSVLLEVSLEAGTDSLWLKVYKGKVIDHQPARTPVRLHIQIVGQRSVLELADQRTKAVGRPDLPRQTVLRRRPGAFGRRQARSRNPHRRKPARGRAPIGSDVSNGLRSARLRAWKCALRNRIMASTEDIRGHYVKVNGTRTFYDEIGEGYPIVCVHTAGACSLEYTYLLPLLAERGFHAYAMDLPGHFRSYPVNWKPHRTIHEHAEFVHAFANTLGLKKPVIMGCSIGGDITLDYAAHHWREMAAGIPMEGLSRSPTFPSPTGADPSVLGAGMAGSARAGGDRIAQSQLLGGKDRGVALAASRRTSQRGGRPRGVGHSRRARSARRG